MKKPSLKIKPGSDRIFLLPELQKKETKAGITTHIHDRIANTAEILAIGPGNRGENGELIPMDENVKVGAKILFQPSMAIEIEINKSKLMVIRESDIIAFL